VQARNAVDLNLLALKQLLEMDPGADFAIERPEVLIPADAAPELFALQTVYEVALDNQPQIAAGKLRQQSAELGVKIARSVGMPTLSAFANLNTNWSSLGRTVDGFQTVFIPVQAMLPDGSALVFELSQTVPNLVDQPYTNQLTRNFGQGVGLALNVPIYNASRASIASQQAELGVRNTQVSNDLLKQQLKADVQRAIADARASKEAYLAAQRSLDAATLSLSNAERRFALGAVNVLELNASKTNFDTAEIELIRSKYQYLFSIKVVDFYLGRQLSLN
jgi:outer membrane protein